MLIAYSDYIGVGAEPGYDHTQRNVELESADSIMDVEATDLLDHGSAARQLKMGKPLAGYADYDYYTNGRRPNDNTPRNINDLSTSSSTSSLAASREPSLAQFVLRRPVESSPWYGQYPGKSIAMYPSRSYDPYIRRYDRYDEQYHRAYPQYFEDMYVHRQRFDPYDSYSPRVPQYPDPYLIYPNRQLDSPPPRDFVKAHHSYVDQPKMSMPYPDSYSNNNKYVSSRTLPHQRGETPRSERVVYYAHLPEVVRTPYDMSPSRPDRIGAGTLVAASPHKQNKKKFMGLQRADNSTNYKQLL
ncbi:uncharacterized protein LOC6565451 [Drosophila grimshawi]|uniref:GH12156 n=1 Tax=Drosophila grimshawi TaxID=7222 RepID=B4JJX8_DROGR|nr:uncharacterized protein LOC6565451 [Drosophila grimshawi]EDV99880.1 GH12156 [Drosophila grimshawi]